MEVILKNTADVQPETMVNEEKLSEINQTIIRKRKKDLSQINLWVPWADLAVLNNLAVSEIVDVVQSSVIIEEGKGFTFQLDSNKSNIYAHEKFPKETHFPEQTGHTHVRFNKFIYELSIR
jgi:hypothetical protein